MTARCPNCRLPMTESELQSGNCPVCEGEFSVEPADSPIDEEKPKSSRGAGRGLLLISIAGLLLLVGSASGFALRPFVEEDWESHNHLFQSSQNTDEPLEPASVKKSFKNADTQADRKEAAKARDRIKKLEGLVAKLTKERDLHKKAAEAAKIRADATERDTKTARAQASKSQSTRVKELQSLAAKLTKELELHKKMVVEANARADKLKQPPNDRVKTLEKLTLKLQRALKDTKAQAQQAKTRELAALKKTDEVRRDGLKALENVRKERNKALDQANKRCQKTIDRVHKQHTRAIKSVRRQLDQQRRLTNKARAEAAKHKKALKKLGH